MAELNLLYKDLLIGVTRFFRDEEAFNHLAENVLPGLVNRSGSLTNGWCTGDTASREAQTATGTLSINRSQPSPHLLPYPVRGPGLATEHRLHRHR